MAVAWAVANDQAGAPVFQTPREHRCRYVAAHGTKHDSPTARTEALRYLAVHVCSSARSVPGWMRMVLRCSERRDLRCEWRSDAVTSLLSMRSQPTGPRYASCASHDS